MFPFKVEVFGGSPLWPDGRSLSTVGSIREDCRKLPPYSRKRISLWQVCLVFIEKNTIAPEGVLHYSYFIRGNPRAVKVFAEKKQQRGEPGSASYPRP